MFNTDEEGNTRFCKSSEETVVPGWELTNGVCCPETSQRAQGSSTISDLGLTNLRNPVIEWLPET